MNKDRVEGKVKDITGRVERQAGEWTNDPKAQVNGAAKQAEGKVQNAWGKAKDAAKQTVDDAHASSKPPQRVGEETDSEEPDAKDARRQG
jgi:uncharacterized protein YjbJ (UPF0337 family)